MERNFSKYYEKELGHSMPHKLFHDFGFLCNKWMAWTLQKA